MVLGLIENLERTKLSLIIFLLQTTVKFETENLVDTELPIFFSFIAHPGFNTTCLESFGFFGDYDIFQGKIIHVNGSTIVIWGDNEDELSIQSRLILPMTMMTQIIKTILKASLINVGITLMMSSLVLNCSTGILGII